MQTSKTINLALALLGLAACGGGDTGAITITLGAEETIAEGIAAGDGDEDITDGWEVSFDRFIVSVGEVRLARAGTSDEVVDETVRVVDLVQIPPSGEALTSFADLTAARWDRVGFALVAPTADAERAGNVGQDTFDAMVAGGCTYFIDGVLTPADGATAMSNPPGGTPRVVPPQGIVFSFCVPASVRFTSCELDGVPGVAIPSGGTATAELTFHGDHMTFPSFTEGAEIVTRRAQWLADADTNGDDVLTRGELEAITGPNLVALFPADTDPGTPGNQGYSLVGAPGGTVSSAWGFLVAQLRTQGHLNGEGECVPEVD